MAPSFSVDASNTTNQKSAGDSATGAVSCCRMTMGTPQLDYAPAAPIRRRRRMRRTIGLSLLAILALAAWRFHVPVWQHAQLLYHQRQCLNYTAPPDQVVYDENNDTVSPLIGTPGYQAQISSLSFLNMRSGKLLPKVAVRPAPELSNYLAAMGNPVSFTPATVFLHERRTKSGLVRLVAVTRSPVATVHILYEFGLTPMVINPAGSMSQPMLDLERKSLWTHVPAPNPADTQNLRFYAGQPDPADPAHFTIKYDLRNASGIIDGRLNEDGATVSLKIISGPATGTNWAVDRARH